MKSKMILLGAAALLSTSAFAQIGAPFIHDPSTIMEYDGKYYTFGTGSGGLLSEDGWTWTSGASRPGGGAAPDAIKIGDRYLVAYSTTGGGLGGGHAGTVRTMWTNDFKTYDESVEVAASLNDEDCDAIDAGLMLDPTTGRLWLTYGTYFGHIRLVELDPKTGKRVEGNEAVDVAIDCEASTMIYKDGYYYLLGTHGTCCDGVNSTYNIIVGRSKQVTGPFIDNVGRDMLKGGGKMVLAAGGRVTGPGHFGRVIISEGVEIMSCHFEADMDLGGRSTLGIRPLLWVNGWPVAGELFKEGTYEIESQRRGYALELTVDFVRMQGGGMRGFGGGGNASAPVPPMEAQKLSDVIGTWPTGNIDVRMNDYMFRPHQRWTITAVPGAEGFLGSPAYKIVIEGTNRALAATAEGDVIAVPEFTGAPEQLWRIEQLTDGNYRIMPKVVPGSKEELALIAVGDCTPTLGKFDMKSDNSKWSFKAH